MCDWCRYLEKLLARQRLGGDQQTLVVARHPSCRQVLVGQLNILAVVLQEGHGGGHEGARFRLHLQEKPQL